MNFGVMLGCSVIIAGLGLLQNSVAVIIGAMLVAPLMTPLIGTGLALVQGNFHLLYAASRAMAMGTGVGLLLGVFIALIVPGDEITTQVSVRGVPNILDLLIAFFAGVAAGYALARPKLSGALPGVAIAVALVPPLTASGIALGFGSWPIAAGALLLYVTNLVAIVLGSALVFRIHGISTPPHRQTVVVRMKRILIGLGISIVILITPLGWRLLEQIRLGQARPASLSLSEEAWQKLNDRLEVEEGIDFLTGARASSEGPEDITLVITTDRVVPGPLIGELDDIINREVGRSVEVKFSILQQAKVGILPADIRDTPDNEDAPAINE